MTGAGLMVRQVNTNSSANREGVRIHDRIVRIANREVAGGTEGPIVAGSLERSKLQNLPIEVEREGRRLSLQLKASIR